MIAKVTGRMRTSRWKTGGALGAVLALALPSTALAESLTLSVPHTVTVHRPFTITASGTGSSQDALNVYLDHHACARHGFDEDSRAHVNHVILAADFHGHFSRSARIEQLSPRRVFVCGYLTYPIGREIARQATYVARAASHRAAPQRRGARFTG